LRPFCVYRRNASKLYAFVRKKERKKLYGLGNGSTWWDAK
jgi:hypothetical protein